ncbi:MAG: hypothetical protein HOI95_28815 [Chromatiales bacterium]|jgi:hypothetical protein|nr:hypothetical protein [Chromatiales bacterium]
MPNTAYRILFMGASYGSLLATKLSLAGHHSTMVCLPNEVEAFNANGAVVRFPVRGREGLVEVSTRALPGDVDAAGPGDVDPGDFDLVCLAMQEPQYRVPPVKELLARVAASGTPAMSIMNMPPIAYLRRIQGLDTRVLEACYTDASVWDGFDNTNITLCSPDPQAFRPPEEPINVLQVTLPTNFKSARFESDAHTEILETLARDIEAARFQTEEGPIQLPVKLKVHDSVFVPLAKWAMLLTGNYRCIQQGTARSIREAVHTDLEMSRAIYDGVKQLCVEIGAKESDLVPFEKYASAADVLLKPSSAARAIDAGAQFIERVDCLVNTIAGQRGMDIPSVGATVSLVQKKLESNRAG